MEDYKKALKMGQKEYHKKMSEGKYPFLPSLLEMLPSDRVLPETKLGLVSIPIELISGTYTAGRQNAFAPNFMPLLSEDTEFATKWAGLSQAHIEEGIHDPIQAYEYKNHFYVKEGNKRVSVLKYFGAVSVPGEVIRILPTKRDELDVIIYYEFVEFYKLSEVNYILFSKKGSYAHLMEEMGMEPDHIWTDIEKEYFYSAFYRFKNLYEDKSGHKLQGTIGDAFLVYIELMGYDNIKNKVPAEMKEDIAKIWSEFNVRREDKVELVMEPEEEKGGSIISNINKILPIPLGSKKLKVAFIHDKNGDSSSWTYAHELGRMYVDEIFGSHVETTEFMNALDDKNPDAVIEKAIEEKNTVIFTTTPQLNAASLRAAIEHPEVKIYNCSLNISHSYIRTYYVRLYEAKLITGIIAGALADNNKIGYVADYPIAGMVANINAFAIGAQMANPRAKVYLKWSSVEGSDPLKEFEQEGITVISGQDMITPNVNRRIFGVNQVVDGEIENVATVLTDWGKVYKKIIGNLLNGSSLKEDKNKSYNYWWGMDAEVADIVCSTKLKIGTKRLIDMVKRNLAERSIKTFEGELIAQDGVIIQKEGELTPEKIVEMDWLAENIIGSIPKISELKEDAKAVVQIQSIEKTKV